MPPRLLHVDDIVAIRHTHAGYSIPYFLACVQEEPVSTKPDERLRVIWLESPEPQDGGCAYPIQTLKGVVRGWVDEIAVGSVVQLVRPLRDEEIAEKKVQLSEDEHHTLLQAMGLKPPKRKKSSEPRADHGAARRKKAKLSKTEMPPSLPPTIRIGDQWSCLWCLRTFNHPPAWGSHSKACTYADPSPAVNQDLSEPAALKKARLKLLQKSDLDDVEMWKRGVLALAATEDDDQVESEEEEDEEEEKEEDEDADAKALAKAAEAEREAQRRQREEADRARAMRVVKRLVSKLPSQPRKLTVEVVLALYTTEEIRAILSATLTEFAAEAAEAAAAEAEGRSSYYRVDGSDNLSEEDEKMLLAKRLVGLVRMRVQQADPHGSEDESSSDSSEEGGEEDTDNEKQAEHEGVDEEQGPSRGAQDNPDSSQQDEAGGTAGTADSPAGSTASASTASRPAGSCTAIESPEATNDDRNNDAASQPIGSDDHNCPDVQMAPAQPPVEQEKHSSAGCVPAETQRDTVRHTERDTETQRDVAVSLRAADAGAEESAGSEGQKDASALPVPQESDSKTTATGAGEASTEALAAESAAMQSIDGYDSAVPAEVLADVDEWPSADTAQEHDERVVG